MITASRGRALGITLLALAACGHEPAKEAPLPPEPVSRAPEDPDRARIHALAAEALQDCKVGLPLLDALHRVPRAALLALAEESGPGWAQAAWEAERAVVPGEKGRGRLDPAGVDSFVARVERRLGVRPPAWWGAALKNAVVYDDTRTTFYNVVPLQTARYTERAGERQVAPGTRLDDLPPAALAGGTLPGSTENAEVLRGPLGVFVAAFSAGSGGFPSPVRRVEQGRIAWQATACSAGRSVLGGVGSMVVELAPAPDAVIVYSAETHGVAIDVMGAERGEPRLRFSSDLGMARHGWNQP